MNSDRRIEGNLPPRTILQGSCLLLGTFATGSDGTVRSSVTTAPDTELDHLRARSTLMEDILRRVFPELAFDVESLRRKSESLTVAEPGDTTSAPENGLESDSDINIEDENCTIKAVDDTVARRSRLEVIVLG